MSATPAIRVDGRYRLERQLGAGATARVWLAFDTVLERLVAIKMLESPIGGDTDHIERFRREARAVARLRHPHIVGVLDSGEHEGVPFIVFEYVDGETLKERIQRVGRLTITEAVAFVIEVARALDAAHQHGIVHRDIKPQNILLDPEAGAKVTDFGIARSLREEGLTVGGHVLGTTDYVSPEQALGREVTGQSDLYSLGIVLYETLTGSVPFRSESAVAVAGMHVRNEIPDVQARRREVSASLAAVVERATAKPLGLRYTRAGQMIADLEEALSIEAARTGSASKSATVVLRSLPRRASARVPLRVRHPLGLGAASLLAVLAAAALIAVTLTQTHHGGASPANPRPITSDQPVTLAQDAAQQYNPFGTSPENPASAGLAIDGNPSTYWQTSFYVDGRLGKSGVGIYVDARPHVAADEAVIESGTPGFNVQIWATDRVPQQLYTPQPRPGITPKALGWQLLGGAQNITDVQTIALHPVGQHRYYLLWITSLGPDPSGASKSVEIDEFTLMRAAGRGARQR